MTKLISAVTAGVLVAAGLSEAKLPDRYFELMAAGITGVQSRLATEPATDLKKLETNPGWRHFPSAILVAAVLHGKKHAAQPALPGLEDA